MREDVEPLTYDEVLAALRLAKRMGDCVPENIEEMATRIVRAHAPRPFHVIVYEPDGGVFDPTEELRVLNEVHRLKTDRGFR